MPYTVNVNVSDAIVTATDFVSSITITETDQTFTITNAVSNFTVTNNVNYITFDADGGYGFDFITKNIGDWSTGTTYSRNDIVRYNYSLYIANTSSTATFVSTLPPPQEPNRWETFWTTDWTFPQLKATLGTFTNLTAGGTVFPVTSGTYGTVLTSNGSGTAYWSSLGELVIWDLSDDLRTNGFNIVSGTSQNDPNPQLTIASGGKNQGNNTSTFKSFFKLHAVPVNQSIGDISSKGNWSHQGRLLVTDRADFYSQLRTTNLSVSYVTTMSEVNIGSMTVAPQGSIKFLSYAGGNQIATLQGGENGEYYIPVSKGFRFPDGTVIDSTAGFIGTGTGTVNLIAGPGIKITNTSTATIISQTTATANVIGGIRPGLGLSIDGQGVLSVTTSNFVVGSVSSLNNGITVNSGYHTTIRLNPATTLTIGGILVGSGLSIDGNGVLSVNTGTTPYGAISLNQDMLTNGYKIKYSAANDNSSLTLGANTVDLKRNSNNGVLIDNTSTTIYSGSSGGVRVTGNESALYGDNIYLRSGLQTIVGSDIYHSELQVSKIYNFSGTGPPFFPQGVQYPDNTVQVTAFQADNGIIPAAP